MYQFSFTGMSFRPKWRNLLFPELSSCTELKSRFLDSTGAPLEMTIPRDLNSYVSIAVRDGTDIGFSAMALRKNTD